MKSFKENDLYNKYLKQITEEIESSEDGDNNVIAFPTKINGYDKDFVVFGYQDIFYIFGPNEEYVEITPENEQFYHIFVDFFNKYDERMTFDDYMDEYKEEHDKFYQGDSNWDSDEVIITEDKGLENFLPNENKSEEPLKTED